MRQHYLLLAATAAIPSLATTMPCLLQFVPEIIQRLSCENAPSKVSICLLEGGDVSPLRFERCLATQGCSFDDDPHWPSRACVEWNGWIKGHQRTPEEQREFRRRNRRDRLLRRGPLPTDGSPQTTTTESASPSQSTSSITSSPPSTSSPSSSTSTSSQSSSSTGSTSSITASSTTNSKASKTSGVTTVTTTLSPQVDKLSTSGIIVTAILSLVVALTIGFLIFLVVRRHRKSKIVAKKGTQEQGLLSDAAKLGAQDSDRDVESMFSRPSGSRHPSISTVPTVAIPLETLEHVQRGRSHSRTLFPLPPQAATSYYDFRIGSPDSNKSNSTKTSTANTAQSESSNAWATRGPQYTRQSRPSLSGHHRSNSAGGGSQSSLPRSLLVGGETSSVVGGQQIAGTSADPPLDGDTSLRSYASVSSLGQQPSTPTIVVDGLRASLVERGNSGNIEGLKPRPEDAAR
ncbi:MAG: hypothetical protein M1827_003226 [Pycnora praestabilis]|nr:MAG: hypothetical protein M1827_003226 [Pycnora praestabilis]